MLEIDLKINGTHIAWYGAQRIEGTTEPESVNMYQVWEFVPPTHERGVTEMVKVATVEHRYGDGAEKLASKALMCIAEERNDHAKQGPAGAGNDGESSRSGEAPSGSGGGDQEDQQEGCGDAAGSGVEHDPVHSTGRSLRHR